MNTRYSSRVLSRGREQSLILALFRCLTVAGALHSVDKSRTPRSSLVRCHAASRRASSAQVFVRNVAFDADVQSLRAAMEKKFGPVSDVWLPRHEDTNKNRGYGKVTFDDSVSMGMALEAGTLRLIGRDLQIVESKVRTAHDRSGGSGGGGGGTGRGSLLQQLRTSRNRTEIAALSDKLGELRSIKEASMAISAWGRVRDWERALALMSEMRERGVEPNMITYSAAISACEKSSQWEHALELLSEMQEHELKPDVIAYSAAISACEKGSQWERALELIDKMRQKGVEPNVITYNAAISACAKGSQWARALELLSEMRQHGIEPNVVTYNAAISACEKGSQWERALELLSEMRERGVEPDVITYNAVISACVKGSQSERTLELLSEMRERGVEPDVITYSAAISSCEKASQWERALELLSEMRERGVEPDVITYSAAISACEKGSQVERALELMDTMRQKGVEPNVVTYNAAISACAKGSRWVRALELMSEMRQHGIEPNVITYNAVISACEKGSQWERALKLLSEMRERGVEPDVITYSAAISACEKGSQWERALELLREMKQCGVEPDVITYNACVQALVAAGNLDEAFVLLHEVPARIAKDTKAYTIHRTLLVACQLAGDTDRADIVKARMELHGVSRGDPAVASAVIDGRFSEFSSEIRDSRSDAAMQNLVTEVLSNSRYEVRFDALPIGFLDSSSEGQQKRSLRHHAEKKALAEMLARGCESLEVDVNIHMCVDCHAFFKGASKSLGRCIEVREPSVLHRFNEGACSCNDQWRWEARFIGGPQLQRGSQRRSKARAHRMPPGEYHG